MKRLVAAAVLLAAVAATRARAEVAVHTIGQHQFKSFRADVHTINGTAEWWTRDGGPPDDDYLNLDGDANGDFPPASVVLAAGKLAADQTPVVAWSRNTAGKLGVYWSYWTSAAGWSQPALLSRPNGDDSLGVRLYVDPRGDLHAVWWTLGQIPGVWHAKLTNGVWSDPALVSNPLLDSRNPGITLSRENVLVITYQDWSSKPIHVLSFLSESFDP